MRIIFIGTVNFSAVALRELISMRADVVGVCTLQSSSFNADHEDLTPIAQAAGIPVCSLPDLNGEEAFAWIKGHSPDVIFCFGWSRLIRNPLLSLPRLGVIGFHPAALPSNRGRHPIIWALVLGLDQTASTFFKMDDGADSGDIISQRFLDIFPSDDAQSLYTRITQLALGQLREIVFNLETGNIQLLPQTHNYANTWRKRGPSDGCIDWRMSASCIHNLVRGLTRPYIGAHFVYKDCTIKVWKTEVVYVSQRNVEPGKVLESSRNNLVIKAGIDAIKLLEYSPKISLVSGTYL